MGHNKVYGKCENFCDVEVIAKENIAIIEGDFTFTSSETEGIDIEYPEGFNMNNSIILSVMNKFSTTNNWDEEYDYMYTALYPGSIRFGHVDDSEIPSGMIISYKIVLLKVA